MSRTVSLIDLSERLMLLAGKVGVGFPRLEDQITTIAADLIVAAAEAGEIKPSELVGLREETSGDRKPAPVPVPVPGITKRIHLPTVPDGVKGQVRPVGNLPAGIKGVLERGHWNSTKRASVEAGS